MSDTNKPNVRSVEFTIADIAIMASSLSLGANTALFYGDRGDAASKRLRELAEKLYDLSPIPKSYRDKNYTWFNAFAALATAKAYHLHFKTSKQYGWEIDSAALVMIVDNRAFQLTETLDIKGSKGIIPAKHRKMFDETLAMIKEAAPMDAEFMNTSAIQVPVKVANEEHWRINEQKEEAAYGSINRALKKAGLRDTPFHIQSLKFSHDKGKTPMYDATVLIRPSDVEKLKTIFALSVETELLPRP